MIEVVEVKTKKQQKEFVNFVLDLYKGNKCFVPPLYSDEMGMFKKSFVYNDQCETVFFNAYADGRMVGRIQGILQNASNAKWNQKRVRFTRMDFVDDPEVSKALFTAVENWAKSKGMEEVVGPLGYSDLEREGLLVYGFDELMTFEEQYNYAYYQKHIEDLGYVKEVGWTERMLRAPKEKDPRVEKLAAKILEKNHLKLGKARNTRQFIKKYGDAFFEILDETYEKIYGTVPFTDGMKKLMLSNFKLIINVKYVSVIVDENDRVVAFSLAMPSISKAVQKSNGHLTPMCILRILHAIKHPEILDLCLIGVLPEYAMKGVATTFLVRLINHLESGAIGYCETNLNLEDNYAIQNQWKNFDNVIHKRRLSYVKKI